MGKDLMVIIRKTRSPLLWKWGNTLHNNHKKNKKLVPHGNGENLNNHKKNEVISPEYSENLNNHKKNKKLFHLEMGKDLILIIRNTRSYFPWKWGEALHNNHKKNKKLFPLETGKTLITIRKTRSYFP